MTRMNKTSYPNEHTSALSDDFVPEDMDAYRIELTRHINRFLAEHYGCWRRCGEESCRRARACCSPQIPCPILPPAPEMSAQEDAECRAEIYRAVKAEVARREAAAADGIDQQS